jgi:hypothetical protein
MAFNDTGQTLEQGMDKGLNEVRERVRPQLEEAKRRLQVLNGQATDFIKEHPAACLVGALGLGYLIARLARRERS